MITTCNCTMKESCTQVSLSCYVFTNAFHASCHAFHHAKECIIRLRVVYESEKARVDQVSESIHPQRCWCLLDPSEETNLLRNEGKPRTYNSSSVL
jgi:hypothetical protein